MKPSSRAFLALVPCLALAAGPATAQEGGKPGSSSGSADEEIEELVGPTYAETLVVTASRTEESLLEAPVSVTVVGQEQIETSAATNYGDLLRGVPGLNVIQTSARDFNFTSRGATSTLATSQLGLVDGRSVYLDFFGFVAWDLLPFDFEDIRQVEVLRGPGSAVWGANALSGVINVRTKSPRELDGGLLRVGAGEQDSLFASLRWADAREHVSYKVSASWSQQDAWDRPSALPDGTPFPASAAYENTGTEQPKLDLRFDYEPRPGEPDLWSFRAGVAGTEGMIHTGIGPFDIQQGTWMSYFETSYQDENLDAKIYWNRLSGDGTNVINLLPFSFDSDTYVAEITAKHAVGNKNLLVYGGNARLNRFDLSIAPRDDKRDEFGAFLEDQITFNEHWLMNVGARVDHFDTIGTTVSPRFSLIYMPNPRHSIRFAYNRAYRAPSLVNNYLETALPNVIVLDPMLPPFVFTTYASGNEDLNEETVDAFELGWTAILGRSTLTMAVYHNETRDVVDFAPVSFYSAMDPPAGWPLPPDLIPPLTLPKEFSYRNIGKVRDQGFEASLNTAWNDHWSTIFSYSYQDEPEVSGDDSPIPLDTNIQPEHQASAQLIADFERAYGSLSVSWTDEAFWSDVLDSRFWGYTDSYFFVNAAIGWRLPNDRGEVVLSGTNLLDDDIQTHVFGDIIGRKVQLELRLRWN